MRPTRPFVRLPCPSGTTLLASPYASASCAPMGRPVKIRSRALDRPMSRGSLTVPPSISGTPARNKGRNVGTQTTLC